MKTGWEDFYERERDRTLFIGTPADPHYQIYYAFCVSTNDIPKGARNEWIYVQKEQPPYTYYAFVWVDADGASHIDESMVAYVTENKTVHSQRGIVPICEAAGPGKFGRVDRPVRPVGRPERTATKYHI